MLFQSGQTRLFSCFAHFEGFLKLLGKYNFPMDYLTSFIRDEVSAIVRFHIIFEGYYTNIDHIVHS